jgi:hypothetical protein
MSNPEIARSVVAAGIRTKLHGLGNGPSVLHGREDQMIPLADSLKLADACADEPTSLPC